MGLNEVIDWKMTVKDSNGSEITKELTADHPLEADAYNTLIISGHMRENAGNEYQGMSIDNIAITVAATQLGGDLEGVTGEFDSINNEYDKNAVYPPLATYLNETATQPKSGTDDMVIETPVAKSTVPGTAQIASAAQTNAPATTITDHPMADGSSLGRVLKTTASTADSVTYDISYIYTETTNGTPISYNVSEFSNVVTNVIELSTGLKNVQVTHSHNGVETPMQPADNENANQDGFFYYNPANGKLYIWSSKYSSFAITFQSDFVAAVNGQGYATLGEAIAAAGSGETVTLLKNVHLPQTITIAAEKAVTLDLNGKAITVAVRSDNATKHYYAIDNYGEFTLIDRSAEQTGSITARGIENLGNGKMTVNGGTIIACDSNGGAAIWNEANLTVNGGTFKTVHVGAPTDGVGVGCLNNNRGTAMITGGTFEGANRRTYAIISTGNINITPAEGKQVLVSGAHGGLAIDSGTAVVNGGSYSSTEYYGLYVSNDGVGTDPMQAAVTVNGGSFTGANYSVWIGSDYNNPVNSTISITGGTFEKPLNAQECTREGAIVVSGGKFAADPSAYLAAGYSTIADGDAYKVIAGIAVQDATGIRNALAEGHDVVMMQDISVDAQKGGYSKAGLVMPNGVTIDGNNKKLTVNYANDTYDCGIYTKGGTIKNLTIEGPFRGVFGSGAESDIVIEKCNIDAVYPFNHDGGSAHSLTVKDSVIHGWTSYGTIASANFQNTKFSLGNSGYDVVAAYTDTVFKDCSFDDGFVVYAQITGFTFTFNNCVKGGTPVTADNFKTLFPDDSDVWTKCTCIVNGVTVAAD